MTVRRQMQRIRQERLQKSRPIDDDVCALITGIYKNNYILSQ